MIFLPELFQLLVLAIMQGFLEFLPVSSEGQILLVAVNIFSIDATTALSIIFWLHLGTAFTVVIFYHRDIFGPLYTKIRPQKEVDDASEAKEQKLFGPLFVFVLMGTIGTMIVGLPLYFLLQSVVSYFAGQVITAIIGALLIVTGIILYFQRGRKGDLILGEISILEAFILGLIQGIAVLPGISRSGMTLTWLLLRGVKREEALRLSFILGVPAAFGIVGVDLLTGHFFWTIPSVLIIITVIALLTGIGALYVLRYTAIRVPWWTFCLILGITVLVLTIPSFLLGPVNVPP